MSLEALAQLAEAHDTAWRACHGTIARQVAEAKKRLSELEVVRSGHQADANKAQKNFDRWSRLASRVDPVIKGESMRPKYRKRIEQCKLYGNDARKAREARDKVTVAVTQLQAEISPVEAEFIYRKRHYCDVRNRYMVAIREAERGNPEALERKLQYMAAGQIDNIEPEEVLYYLHERQDSSFYEVHMFYGGADEPDGDGHAHLVLHVTPQQTKVYFHRAPK